MVRNLGLGGRKVKSDRWPRSPSGFADDKNCSFGMRSPEGSGIDCTNEPNLPYRARRDRAQFVESAQRHAVEVDLPWHCGAEVDVCKEKSRTQALDRFVGRGRAGLRNLGRGHDIS